MDTPTEGTARERELEVTVAALQEQLRENAVLIAVLRMDNQQLVRTVAELSARLRGQPATDAPPAAPPPC